MKEFDGKTTLFDRIVVGASLALIVFLTLSVGWVAVSIFLLRFEEALFVSSFKLILVISCVAGIFGFFNKEGFLLNVLESLWKLLVGIFKSF